MGNQRKLAEHDVVGIAQDEVVHRRHDDGLVHTAGTRGTANTDRQQSHRYVCDSVCYNSVRILQATGLQFGEAAWFFHRYVQAVVAVCGCAGAPQTSQ